MRFRSAYDGLNRQISDSTALSDFEPTLAQQQFKDDSDPNVIMKQFARTNDPTLLQQTSPRYGDFSSVTTYQDSLNTVITAQAAFDALPSALRRRFSNDPVQLLAFVSDVRNTDEAIRLGLVSKPKEVGLAPTATQTAAGDKPASATPAGGA